MLPTEYEHALAAHYRTLGYEVQLTPASGDYGIDLFASLGSTKLGIQAKMYGTGRRVNREMIMQLHGARCYFDCTSAVLATDGQLLPDAQQVADKLNIQVLRFVPTDSDSLKIPIHTLDSVTAGEPSTPGAPDTPSSVTVTKADFDFIWQTYVMPLEGAVLQSEKSRENTILKVDWTGVHRLTSHGKPNTLPIEIFRSAICHLLSHCTLTRKQINDQFARRGSSGVFLILEQIPLFVRSTNPLSLTYKK